MLELPARIRWHAGRTRRELPWFLDSLERGEHLRDKGYGSPHSRLKANPALARAKDKHGGTALHAAAFHASLDIPNLLLSLKANVNAKDNGGWTPLHSAASCANAMMVKWLLDKGADVNAQTNEGETVLSVALRHKAAEEEARATPGLFVAWDPRDYDGVVELLSRHGGHQ